MPRLARVVIPGLPHHITQRGNRRQPVFFREADYPLYLQLLREQTQRWGLQVWAYCLMTNHVHLIVVPQQTSSLTRGIGDTHRRYTRAINFREGWRGYLWQGRFASFPLDEQHLYRAIRYVERNPVHAGLVARAADYPWSSAPAHVRGTPNPLLSHPALTTMVGDWAGYLQTPEEHGLVARVEHQSRTGRPWGDEAFITRLEHLTGRQLRRQKPGPKARR